jgi:hypothetical protein
MVDIGDGAAAVTIDGDDAAVAVVAVTIGGAAAD